MSCSSNTNNQTDEVEDDGDPSNKYILWIGAPLIMLFGFVGNISVLIIICRLQKHFMAFSYFFQALVVSDTFLLLFSLFPRWVASIASVNVKSLNLQLLCIQEAWVYYAGFTASSWLLAGMILVRTLGSVWTYTVRGERPSTVSKLIICLIAVIAIVLPILSNSSADCTSGCFPVDAIKLQKTTAGAIWSWVYFAVVFQVPFLVIVCCDGWLYCTMLMSKKRLSRTTPPSSALTSSLRTSSTTRNSFTHTTTSTQYSTAITTPTTTTPTTTTPTTTTPTTSQFTSPPRTDTTDRTHTCSHIHYVSPAETTQRKTESGDANISHSHLTMSTSRSRKTSDISTPSVRTKKVSTEVKEDCDLLCVCQTLKRNSMLVVLVVSSLAFVVLIMPRWLADALITSQTIPRGSLSLQTLQIFELMCYINAGIKFYLYCLTGAKFRNEIRKILTDCFVFKRVFTCPFSESRVATIFELTPRSSRGVSREVSVSKIGPYPSTVLTSSTLSSSTQSKTASDHCHGLEDARKRKLSMVVPEEDTHELEFGRMEAAEKHRKISDDECSPPPMSVVPRKSSMRSSNTDELHQHDHRQKRRSSVEIDDNIQYIV